LCNSMTLKDISEISHNFGVIVAMFVGGLWTYRKLIRKREVYPRANVGHQILHKEIDNRNKVLLRITAYVVNIGDTVIELEEGYVRVHQMVPWPTDEINTESNSNVTSACVQDGEVDWPMLSEKTLAWEKDGREIEPGEKDEFHFDFVLDADIKTVVIYSYFRNKVKPKRDIGWNKATIYEMDNHRETK
jgi:hypothetical protein